MNRLDMAYCRILKHQREISKNYILEWIAGHKRLKKTYLNQDTKQNLARNLINVIKLYKLLNQSMSLNQTNSLKSTFNFGRSTFIRYCPQDEIISLNKLIEQCMKNSITIIQLPDKRLQSGLNILPLKAKSKAGKDTLVFFLTKFSQAIITITAYLDGKKIAKANASNELEIVRLMTKLFEQRKSQPHDFQSHSLKLIQKLDKKCTQIAKQQKNQMMAIQKLKSTLQYQSLIEHQIQLSMEIQSLSQSLTDTEQLVQKGNQQLLEKILQIEVLKNQIEQNQYEYEEATKCFRNVKETMNEMMEKQQMKVNVMEVKTQIQLAEFIVEAKKLKKLQLQKRFLH